MKEFELYDHKPLRQIKLEDRDADHDLHLAMNVMEDGSLFFNFQTLINPISHYMLGDLTLDKESAKRFIEAITVKG